MNVTLTAVVLLTTAALCYAADAECKYRKTRKLALHWPDPSNCTRYYRCTNRSVKREVVCAEGKVYNAKTGKCSNNSEGLCKLTLAMPLDLTVNPCANETSGVYLAQPGYCRNFYICEQNQAYPQICDAGSRFNSTARTCVPDTNSECWQNKCVSERNGTYLPNESSCSSFYLCSAGEAIEQECGNGSYFNTTKRICLPDPDGQFCWENLCIGKRDGEFVQNIVDCYSYYVCVAGKPIQQYCPEDSYFDSAEIGCVPGKCLPNTTEIPTTDTTTSTTDCITESTEVTTPVTESACDCPGGYKEGELVPFPNYPENCDKYYECSNGKLEEKECGEGNRFNSALGVCEPDVDNICWPVITTECPEVTTPVTEAACDCPGGYKEGELVPFPNYPENCDKYYECSNGKLEEKECGEGNRFNSALGVCEPDVDNICWPVITTECPEVTTPVTEAACDCPGGYKEGALVPFPNYPENCDKYYECSNGKLEEKECGEGNRFNSALGVCEPDVENVCSRMNCDDENYNLVGRRNKRSVDRSSFNAKITASVSNNLESDCICPGGYKESELLPYPNFPENCDKYYICTDGRLQGRECGVGNYFDNNLGTCEPDVNNICWPAENNCTCPGGYKESELLPYPNFPENCDKYYICTDGRLQGRECGVGNYFDNNLGTCVPDVNNICWPNICNGQPDDTFLPDPTNCTSFYYCKGGKAELTDCPPEKWFNPSENICMPDYNASCINPCKDTTGATNLPNPDCSKYFFCNDGQPYIKTCPEGEGFDITLGYCHADAVCEATMCVGKSDGTTFPLVGNDTKFYLCIGGVAQIRECLSGVFNQAVGICLEQPSPQCDQSKCNSTNPEDNAFAPLTNIDNTAFCLCRGKSAFLHHCAANYTFQTDLGICESNAPCDPVLCDSFPDNTRSQNRNDSHSFCLCVGKQQVIVDCPNNQTYNAVTRTCQVLDERCSTTFCLTAPEYSTFPALNNDTDGFCECVSSGSIYKLCGNGKKYNVEKGICLADTGDVCSGSLCSGNIGLVFGTDSDPHSFCYCINDGFAIKETCPNSEIFNKDLLICQAEGCDGQICLTNPKGPFPALNEPYAFCLCESSDPSSVTKHPCVNGTRFDPNYLICKVDPCDKNFCSNLCNDGIPYPANNYPPGYCVCNAGIPELHSCSDGTLFNPISRQCGLPSNVDCEACQKCLMGLPKFLQYQGVSTTSCLGTYSEGEYVPHPTNNQLYYICYNAKLTEGDCGQGNVFDQYSQTCQPLTRGFKQQNKHIMRTKVKPEHNVRALKYLKNNF